MRHKNKDRVYLCATEPSFFEFVRPHWAVDPIFGPECRKKLTAPNMCYMINLSRCAHRERERRWGDGPPAVRAVTARVGIRRAALSRSGGIVAVKRGAGRKLLVLLGEVWCGDLCQVVSSIQVLRL